MPNEFTITWKRVDELLFDPSNPRIPSTIDTTNDTEVIKWLLRDASIVELMGAIGQNGYFVGEPVLVIPSEMQEGKFEVVEGNRRLCAVKLLNDPTLAPVRKKSVQEVAESAEHRPDKLPVVIYHERDQILDYLGYRHITGIKEWDPLAKAKYLWQLREAYSGETPDEQFRILAKAIGSKSGYVARLLTGYYLLQKIVDEDFFDIDGLDQGSVDFSIFTTALSYSNLVSFLGLASVRDIEAVNLDSQRLRELTEWLFEPLSNGKTRLGESRNLSKLADVVDSDVALAAFRKGDSIEDVHKYTEEPGEVFREAIRSTLKQIRIAQDYVIKVDDLIESDASNAQEASRTANAIYLTITNDLESKK